MTSRCCDRKRKKRRNRYYGTTTNCCYCCRYDRRMSRCCFHFGTTTSHIRATMRTMSHRDMLVAIHVPKVATDDSCHYLGRQVAVRPDYVPRLHLDGW
jgi:hypothetical protein